jgi:hypothetical protein
MTAFHASMGASARRCLFAASKLPVFMVAAVGLGVGSSLNALERAIMHRQTEILCGLNAVQQARATIVDGANLHCKILFKVTK